MDTSESLYNSLPTCSGVYFMKDGKGHILYIGKATNLKRRVSSYFQKAHDYRIEKMVGEIKVIECRETDTALEALLLESYLIKIHQPPYNIREKDDKSFLYVHITREPYPRLILVRGRERETGTLAKPLAEFGPFVSSSHLRYALKLLRRIFPWHTHTPEELRQFRRPCFDYEIGRCPGTCAGLISKEDYRRNIKNLIRFFCGEKKMIIRSLERDMVLASKAQEYERAAEIKRQLFSLRHIRDFALIGESETLDPRPQTLNPMRIEGYDISNISGTSAVGSMVVFTNGEPDPPEYRKFKIRTIAQSNDVGMLKEVLRRRFARRDKDSWPIPHLLLIDGGKPQVNAAHIVLDEVGLRIPIVGIAKGPTRKKNEFIGVIPQDISEDLLIRVRDEAHRFAIAYHKAVRGRNFIPR